MFDRQSLHIALLVWGFRGGQGTVAYYMVRISNFIVFLYSDVLFYLFHRYMCECLFGKQKKQ